MMPAHRVYCEPYFGGGAVLFAKPCEGISEVVNDVNGQLTNFWLVLQGTETFREFERKVQAIPFSELEWQWHYEKTLSAGCNGAGSVIDDAVNFFVRYRQSRQGIGRDFATLSVNRTRRGMNEQASAWLSAVDGLREAHERLRRVVILHRDALEVIRQQDSPETLFYLDPPYMHETRETTGEYAYEMSNDDHARLLLCLEGIRGRFLLSGYPSELYETTASRCGWSCRRFSIDNKASGAKTKEKKTECVWSNFEPCT